VVAFRDLYPFRSHYLTLSGWKYHYVDEGPTEAVKGKPADPLVMLHGNPTWSFHYRALIAAFSHTHRVVAPDHMGCGLSDKPHAYSYTLAQHINNLEALLDTLKLEHLTLFLHDWGGPIGMGYALRHPERVKRFVVFNTAAFPASRIPFRINICKLPGFGALAVRGLNAFAGLAPTMACAKRERMTPAVKAGYLAPYDSFANRVAILRFVQDIPTRPSHPTYRLVAEIGKGLVLFKDHPMLIIWGAQDWCFTTDFLKEWQARFPNAEVHLVPDAGHYVVEDAHERIIPWVREFLAKHPIPPHPPLSPEAMARAHKGPSPLEGEG
jgi:pimeloyl-ACP methyl ester carboxylesterase